MLGKLPGLVLAVNEVAIDLDVEDSPGAGDHLAIGAKVLLDVCRQTDGCGFVISLHAVFD